MKYPYISNWISFRQISDDFYQVENHVLDTICLVSTEEMEFARKLDGKTDPWSIDDSYGGTKTSGLLKRLSNLGVIRDGGFIHTESNGYLKTVIRTTNSHIKTVFSQLINMLLMVGFLPIMIIGACEYKQISSLSIQYGNLSGFEKFVFDHHTLITWIIFLFALSLGAAVHEFSHATACRSYGGRVFEYGIAVGIIPGFYTLMEDGAIKKRYQKIQVLLAGIESNIILAGFFLLIAGLFPNLRIFFALGANVNMLFALANTLAVGGSDGMKVIMLLIGMDEYDNGLIEAYIKKKVNKKQSGDVCPINYAKHTACWMLAIIKRIWPLMILIDFLSIVGAIL